jgi:hypothetical protein
VDLLEGLESLLDFAVALAAASHGVCHAAKPRVAAEILRLSDPGHKVAM